MPKYLFSIIFTCLGLVLSAVSIADEAVDATDPTKIYSFLGGGPKYTSYTNDEYMAEFRLIGNIGVSESDMLLGEFGYGKLQGSDFYEDESGWTGARFRWFHLFDMDHEAMGYRGAGSQVDVQLAGELPGTDGQNMLLVGYMPTWNFSEHLSLYLSLNIANSWDKSFEKYNGAGTGFDAQIIYNNEDWWPGAQIRLMPAYNYFLTGELDGEGSGNLDINIGGAITPTLMWDVTWQKNFDKDLHAFRRDRLAEIENDWNLFFNVTRYF